MRTLKLNSSGVAQFATKTRCTVSMNGVCLPTTIIPPGWIFTHVLSGNQYQTLAPVTLGPSIFSGRTVLVEALVAGALSVSSGNTMTPTTPLPGSPTLSLPTSVVASNPPRVIGRNATTAAEDVVTSGGNDLDFRTGRLEFIESTDAIAQKLRIGLRIQLGEFFADLDVGLPYYQEILVKNPSLGRVQQIMKQAILSCEGIVAVNKLRTQFDARTRNLTLSFEATMQDGGIVPVRDSFIIARVA